MFSFSTCWNSSRHIEGRAMLNEVRALGFEWAELGHGTRLTLLEGAQQAVAAGEIKISSLHNFCPLPLGVMHSAPDYYLPSSTEEGERQSWVRQTMRTLDTAMTLGVKAVVLHLGVVPMRNYTFKLLKMQAKGRAETPRFIKKREKALLKRDRRRRLFVERVWRSLDQVVPAAQKAGVRFGLETRMRIEEIPDVQETLDLLQRYGTTVAYWHDVGHAQIKENLGVTTQELLLNRFRGQTAGIHLQDFSPPANDHLPPGFGTFDFSRLAPYTSDEIVLAWEIHPEWKAEQITQQLQQTHTLLRNQPPA